MRQKLKAKLNQHQMKQKEPQVEVADYTIDEGLI